MRSTWHKEAGSCTLSPELKWSCREGEFENPQNSQNLLRRTYTDNWDVFLNNCTAAINTTINRSIGETPFYAISLFSSVSVINNVSTYRDIIFVSVSLKSIFHFWSHHFFQSNLFSITPPARKDSKSLHFLTLSNDIIIENGKSYYFIKNIHFIIL